MTWLQSTGWAYRTPNNDFHALGTGLLPLISGDVIRPSLSWLLTLVACVLAAHGSQGVLILLTVAF